MHSITALCRLTGLNASTLRSWERRYGVPKPGRSATGRRTYPQGEVDRLVRIARLLEEGHAIGDLHELSIERLDALVATIETVVASEDRASEIVRRLLAAVMARDLTLYRRRAGEVIGLLPAVYVAEEVLSPLLLKVAEERAAGHLPRYVESLTTALTQQLLFMAVGWQPWPPSGSRIIFATLAGEDGETLSLLAWYIAVSSGYNATFVELKLQEEEIATAAEDLSASLVFVSLGDGLDERQSAVRLGRLMTLLATGVDLWTMAPPKQPLHAEPLSARVRRFGSLRAFADALELSVRR